MPGHHLLARWLLAVAVLSASLPLEAASESDATKAEGDPLAAYAQSEEFTHNITWHKQVREDEIRSSWFLNGSPGIAMVCTADLSSSEVTTSREVYEHASQSTKTRELSHAQVLTLRKLIEELPPSAEAPEFKNLVLVSVVENGTAKTRLYNRLSLPRNIVRLYDLTGAYVDMEDSDDTEAGVRVKAGDALPAMEDGVGEKRAVVSEEEAVRALLRAYRAKSFGTQAPAGWPEKVVRHPDKWTWVVDIDTSKLPGGFPEQFVVSVSGTGGHSGRPKLEAFTFYDGFKADQIALRKTVQLKGTNAATDTVKASSAEACQAATRVFSRLSFLSKTRNDVLKLIGAPATISDYNSKAEDDPNKPLVYIFDSGFGGRKYTLMFRNGVCTDLETEDME